MAATKPVISVSMASRCSASPSKTSACSTAPNAIWSAAVALPTACKAMTTELSCFSSLEPGDDTGSEAATGWLTASEAVSTGPCGFSPPGAEKDAVCGSVSVRDSSCTFTARGGVFFSSTFRIRSVVIRTPLFAAI